MPSAHVSTALRDERLDCLRLGLGFVSHETLRIKARRVIPLLGRVEGADEVENDALPLMDGAALEFRVFGRLGWKHWHERVETANFLGECESFTAGFGLVDAGAPLRVLRERNGGERGEEADGDRGAREVLQLDAAWCGRRHARRWRR